MKFQALFNRIEENPEGVRSRHRPGGEDQARGRVSGAGMLRIQDRNRTDTLPPVP